MYRSDRSLHSHSQQLYFDHQLPNEHERTRTKPASCFDVEQNVNNILNTIGPFGLIRVRLLASLLSSSGLLAEQCNGC